MPLTLNSVALQICGPPYTLKEIVCGNPDLNELAASKALQLGAVPLGTAGGRRASIAQARAARRRSMVAGGSGGPPTTPGGTAIPPRLVTNGSVSWSGGTLLELRIDTVGGAPPPLGEVVFSPMARTKRRGFGGGEDEAEQEVVSLAQLLPDGRVVCRSPNMSHLAWATANAEPALDGPESSRSRNRTQSTRSVSQTRTHSVSADQDNDNDSVLTEGSAAAAEAAAAAIAVDARCRVSLRIPPYDAALVTTTLRAVPTADPTNTIVFGPAIAPLPLPAGQRAMFIILARDHHGRLRTSGGEDWVVRITKKVTLNADRAYDDRVGEDEVKVMEVDSDGLVEDLLNGQYKVTFEVLEPGTYHIHVESVGQLLAAAAVDYGDYGGMVARGVDDGDEHDASDDGGSGRGGGGVGMAIPGSPFTSEFFESVEPFESVESQPTDPTPTTLALSIDPHAEAAPEPLGSPSSAVAHPLPPLSSPNSPATASAASPSATRPDFDENYYSEALLALKAESAKVQDTIFGMNIQLRNAVANDPFLKDELANIQVAVEKAAEDESTVSGGSWGSRRRRKVGGIAAVSSMFKPARKTTTESEPTSTTSPTDVTPEAAIGIEAEANGAAEVDGGEATDGKVDGGEATDGATVPEERKLKRGRPLISLKSMALFGIVSTAEGTHGKGEGEGEGGEEGEGEGDDESEGKGEGEDQEPVPFVDPLVAARSLSAAELEAFMEEDEALVKLKGAIEAWDDRLGSFLRLSEGTPTRAPYIITMLSYVYLD